jgi:hypothetical protein
MTPRAGGIALILSFFAALGCSSNIEIGRNQSGIGPAQGGSGVGGTGAGGSSGTGGGECVPVTCQGKGFVCGNCRDDDGDGAIDADDIHCTGPCDDNESSFAVDIREGTGPACKQDCFFDSDVGSGNDGCNWSHACDQESKDPGYPPSGDPACAYDENASIPGMSASCAELREDQDAMCGDTCCSDICGPLVPNGCDCFGCCNLPAGSERYVWLGSPHDTSVGCTEETLDEPSICRPCTPVPSCKNDCDPCEVCVGRTAPDPSCASGGAPACPTGMNSCGEDGPRCATGEYCITGCCVPQPK